MMGKKQNSKIIIIASQNNQKLLPLVKNRPPLLFKVAGKTILEWNIKAARAQEIDEIIVVTNTPDKRVLKDQFFNKNKKLTESGFCSIVTFDDEKGITQELLVEHVDQKTEHLIIIEGNVLSTSQFLNNALKLAADKNEIIVISETEKEETTFFSAVLPQKVLNEKVMFKGRFKCLKEFITLLKKNKSSYQKIDSKEEKGEKKVWKINYLWQLLDANQVLIKTIKEKHQGTIEKGVTIKGKVSIHESARIRAGSYLEGPLFIGPECDIGPNCYLRKGVSLGRGVRIGNACELKNTIVYDDTHIAHLSYVGDSIVGEKCNFGAGTITGNLRLDDQETKAKVEDNVILTGRRKLGVIMGDNVKTAINTYFMPGVIVGNNAAIGTGVILNRNLQDHTFIFLKQKYEQIEWYPPLKKKGKKKDK
jgi:bifunctional UDP-N-acetylglucosamine pyrophosphorylase/glucosamine-1-phosphate N-acetyltransferase